MELVKLLHVHDKLLIFSYSGPSGIFGTDRNQNTAYAGASVGDVRSRFVALSISSH